MNGFLLYLLKSGMCAAILWGAYHLLLRKEPSFVFNRMYLLAIIPLSCVIPLLHIPLLPAADIPSAPLLSIGAPVIAVLADGPETAGSIFSAESLLCGLYVSGIIVNLFYLTVHFIKTQRIVNRNRLPKSRPYTAFTFFRSIYIDKDAVTASDYEKMLLHEQVHARQLHSLDLLVVQLFLAFQWFNPFAWKLKKSLTEVHEYLADAHVIAQGVDVRKYKQLLLAQATGIHPEYVSGFSYSLTKKRLIMMTKTNRNKLFLFKLYCLFLITAIPVAMFGLSPVENNTVQETEKINPEDGTTLLLSREVVQSDENSYTVNLNGQTIAEYDAPTKKQPATIDTTTFTANDIMFKNVDVKPTFKGGGEDEFTRYVFKNLTYPQEAASKNIAGRVIIKFVIDTDGSVTDVEVMKGVDPSLDKAAVNVIKASPKWTPGIQKGKPVRVQYMFPVIFKTNKLPNESDWEKAAKKITESK